MGQITLEIIGLAILVNLFTHWFSPIQKIKYNILDRLPDWMAHINCNKCMGLWIGLAYFLNPIYAALVSLTSYLIDYLIYWIDNKRNSL